MLHNTRLWIAMVVFISGLLPASTGFAKVTEEEAARLGKDLTYIGAERAGNAEGTIPAWQGGLTYATHPDLPKLRPGDPNPDPFGDDKPLFTITAQNAKDYADKLTPSHMALFKKYPHWKMRVFATRRTSVFFERIRKLTLANAATAVLSQDLLYPENAKGGIPFPIAKNGNEAILNHLFSYHYDNVTSIAPTYVVLGNGTIVDNGTVLFKGKMPFHMQGRMGNPQRFNLYAEYISPPRRKGEIIMWIDDIKGNRKVWTYIPGQRRVRRAPTIAYDTPDPSTGNLATYDDAFMYNGKIDRYHWKLLGKKEIYIMYNNFKAELVPLKEILTPQYMNPDVLRWELHRVWVVEATVKPGSRHVYGKRVFYLDEDTWRISIQDKYDNRGRLWRASFSSHYIYYHYGFPSMGIWNHYDFTSETYSAGSVNNELPKRPVINQPNQVADETFTPEYLRRAGRR